MSVYLAIYTVCHSTWCSLVRGSHIKRAPGAQAGERQLLPTETATRPPHGQVFTTGVLAGNLFEEWCFWIWELIFQGFTAACLTHQYVFNKQIYVLDLYKWCTVI